MARNAIVVVGAGLAGLRSVESLRAAGFDGRLTLVGDEAHPPYDRPPLSKEVLLGQQTPESTTLRTPEHLRSLDVELVLSRSASQLDLARRAVQVETQWLDFSGMVIATGSAARPLPEGFDIPGVHTLRTMNDARAIRAGLEGASRVVIVGGGFIGGEVAASARRLGLDVVIVEALPTPLARAVGTEMGVAYATLHRDHGTHFRLGVGVERLEGAGRVERVRLTDGSAVDADLVVVGIGAVPNVGWLAGSGLRIADGVVCDAGLCAGPQDVYVAGDAARWPNSLFDVTMRCEQWTNAAQQARHVAGALLDRAPAQTPFTGSNYFWSDQYGLRIQFAGVTSADEVRVVSGSVEAHRFVALYRRGPRLVGVLAFDCSRALMRFKVLIERRATWEAALAEAARLDERTVVAS